MPTPSRGGADWCRPRSVGLDEHGALDESVLAQAPEGCGVYRFRALAPFPRLRGEKTDILYVGRSKTLRSRLTGPHAAKAWIVDWLATEKEDRRAVLLEWTMTESDADSRLRECLELHEFAHAHGEQPPFNAKWEGYPIGRALTQVAAELHEGHWWGPTDYADDCCTWMGLQTRAGKATAKGGRWALELLWLWPEGGGWAPPDAPLPEWRTGTPLAGAEDTLWLLVSTQAGFEGFETDGTKGEPWHRVSFGAEGTWWCRQLGDPQWGIASSPHWEDFKDRLDRATTALQRLVEEDGHLRALRGRLSAE